jgi:hypothetical protein
MKKQTSIFLIGIFLAGLLLEGTTRLISPLLGPPLLKWNTMEDAKTLKLGEFVNEFSSPTYVLMGNSTTLIGFNPTVFDSSAGLPAGSSFNAAMNGSEIKELRDFACSYIIENVKPKNLVILFSNVGMAQNVSYEGKLKSESVLARYSYLYKYRNTFRDPMTLNTIIRILRFHNLRQGIVYRWADNLDAFGYTKYPTPTNEFSDPGWNPASVSTNLALVSVDKDSLKYLIEIRDVAKSRGVNLIIGTVPTLAFSPVYRNSIQQIARELGVGFVQGNDAVGQGRFFQDGVHLNQSGATEFSKFLARELPKLATG